MRKRLFLATFLALCALIALLSVVTARVAYNASLNEALMRGRGEARALADRLNAHLEADASVVRAAGGRLTIIDAAGAVVSDSAANASAMENHADREEFIEARETGEGEAIRESATLGEAFLYCAIRLDDGRVLRVARAQKTALGLLMGMRGALIASALVAAALAAAISRLLASVMVKPLLTLDLEHPDANDVYEELTPLLARLSRQQSEIRERALRERERDREIAEITGAMREGLMVLDGQMKTLFVNDSAKRLLGVAGEVAPGAHLLTLNRDEALVRMSEEARAGRMAEGTLTVNGKTLEARLSPVPGAQGTRGFALLISDATEKRQGEAMRREFSANVSHELMTPLTSISGYAELIAGGLVKPGDVTDFAGRILSESRRMIALVEDILRLSRLDEGGALPDAEDIPLTALVKEAAQALSDKAAQRSVTLDVSGDDTRVTGARQLAWEIAYNLTDNAIKYNVAGGRVTVRVEKGTLTVRDTGIGIPPAYREKVFERFFRVDKSRSKATGGTGLGLSIVKHAAKTLGARLTLTSREGEGTCVQVDFTHE